MNEGSSGSSATPGTSWSRQQVQDLVDRLDYAYQRMELPYGLVLKGDDRRSTVDRIFPADMTGMSVLDVGCNSGYFCFEAMRRGATRVVGVDVNAEALELGRELGDCLGLHPEFRLFDFEAESLDERFDYVLCLNVLHHVRYPVRTLKTLVDLTRNQVVLELAGFGRKDAKKVGLGRFMAPLLHRMPIIWVGNSGMCGRHHARAFLLTPAAVKNIVTWHHNSCARVDVTRSDFKNRSIVTIHKRRIDTLLVVAGLPASGKSTLVERLQRGEEPALAKLIGQADMRDWPVAIAGRLHKMTQPHHEGVVLEYNLFHVHAGGARSYERDEVLQLLENAQRVVVLTVWPDDETLKQQVDARDETLAAAGKKDAGELAAFHQTLRTLYDQPGRIGEYMRQWMSYIVPRASDHHLISVGASGDTPAVPQGAAYALAPQVAELDWSSQPPLTATVHRVEPS